MPNFSSLARLEVPEKFVWVVGWGLQSHFHVKPNRCVVLCWGWGFDNINPSYIGQMLTYKALVFFCQHLYFWSKKMILL